MQLVCYGNAAGYLPGFTDDVEALEQWGEDFLDVVPQLRGRVVAVHGQTWQHCFAVLSPQGSACLEDLRASVGDLHFAGDYTSATAGTHSAYDKAHRVARTIRAALVQT